MDGEWTDRRTNRWTDGRTSGGQTDKRTNGEVHVIVFLNFPGESKLENRLVKFLLIPIGCLISGHSDQ